MRTDKQNIPNYDPINVYIRDTSNTIIASGAYTSPGSYSFTFRPSSSSSDYTFEYYVVDASSFCFFRADNISISSPSTTYITVCDTLHAGDYRYGFNGMEKDDEIKGKGNSINYTYRMHDPRLGRFFAVDPLTAEYPFNSPYAFSENCVINAIELEGLEKVHVYNETFNKHGKSIKVYSHTYIDNQLKININQVNTYYGGKIPGDVTYKTYGKGSSISFEIKDANDKNLKSNAEVRKFFNPQPIVQDPPVEEVVTESRRYIEVMMDEAWNKGDYGRYLRYWANDQDQRVQGNKGALYVADKLDKISQVTGYVPVVGTIVSSFTGGLSMFMKSAVEFDEGDPNAAKNSAIRAITFTAVIVGGNKVDNVGVLSDGGKAVIGGGINQASSIIEGEATK